MVINLLGDSTIHGYWVQYIGVGIHITNSIYDTRERFCHTIHVELTTSIYDMI